MTGKNRDPLVVLGSNVKRFRLHHGLTVKALAERSSLDRKTIFLIERGKHSANVATITLIADALETETWMLMVDPSSQSPSKFLANVRVLFAGTSAPIRETLSRFIRRLSAPRSTTT